MLSLYCIFLHATLLIKCGELLDFISVPSYSFDFLISIAILFFIYFLYAPLMTVVFYQRAINFWTLRHINRTFICHSFSFLSSFWSFPFAAPINMLLKLSFKTCFLIFVVAVVAATLWKTFCCSHLLPIQTYITLSKLLLWVARSYT